MTNECLFCEYELKLVSVVNDTHEGKVLKCSNCGFQSPVCEDNDTAINVYQEHYTEYILDREI